MSSTIVSHSSSNTTTSNSLIDPVLLNLSQHPEPANPDLATSLSQNGNCNVTRHAPLNAEAVSAHTRPTQRANHGRKRKEADCEPAGSDRPFKMVQLANAATDVTIYHALPVKALKDLCRERQLKVGGNKRELVVRLESHDQARSSTTPNGDMSPSRMDSRPSPAGTEANMPHDADAVGDEADPTGAELDGLEESFQMGLAMEDEDNQVDFDDNDDTCYGDATTHRPATTGGETKDDEYSGTLSAKAAEARAWVDSFILTMRRKSGRQTEESALRLWKRWLPSALTSVPQVCGHAKLFNKKGNPEGDGDDRLSAASLKKVMTMLGRIRRRQCDDDPTLDQRRPAFSTRSADFYKAVMIQAQRVRLDKEDFDITENTILDSQLFPEHFEQVKQAILMRTSQLPSIIKAHFCWTWQCTTLNRGDELITLLLSCIQPLQLFIPDYTTADGRRSGRGRHIFSVLSLYHETKVAKPGQTEPDYNCVLPNKDPLRCPIGALGLILYYIFDHENLISQIPEWDWSSAATWRKTTLLFGKSIGKPCSAETLREMYRKFLQQTTIKAAKKLHLARRSVPTMMEDMGVNPDEIDAVGHWKGNVRREVYSAKIPKAAVTALAGFYVGEQYNVPWASVEVPHALQVQIFPFVEPALANLKSRDKINHGTVNFLQLLQQLRPFFWRMLAAVKEAYPESPLLKRLAGILQSPEAAAFLASWPAIRKTKEGEAQALADLSNHFKESATQSAFISLSARSQDIEMMLREHSAQLGTLTRRTDHLSPSQSTTIPHPDVSALSSAARGMQATLHNSRAPSCCAHTCRQFAPSTGCAPDALLPALPIARGSAAALPAVSSAMPSSCRQSLDAASTSPSHVTHALSSPDVSLPPQCPPAPPSLHPCVVTHLSKKYHILPLSPGPSPPRTFSDLILPPPVAFCMPSSLASPEYPTFTARNCSWGSIFGMIHQPSFLWECWGPGNLGDYNTVQELWRAWEEGAFIEGIGRKPPLRLVDMQWGTRRARRQRRGVYSSGGRIRMPIRIDAAMASGKTMPEAIVEYERSRGSMTLPQFHRSLQSRKKKPTASATLTTPSATPTAANPTTTSPTVQHMPDVETPPSPSHQAPSIPTFTSDGTTNAISNVASAAALTMRSPPPRPCLSEVDTDSGRTAQPRDVRDV
ncbi:hypothetical protein A0H81_13774 [Grifola frondosa]|uniref:SAP domain-containing protein n=1 Tax=Grifola frondosa TaxID=5627 RepID=A0A1C7LNI2_GRIFR|nr:hypothetical protein A0H81_13774 [Grifola frondosa]